MSSTILNIISRFQTNLINKTITSTSPCIVAARNYAAVRKRFYRKTGILRSDGKFEITLDQRKLKTPKGNLFVVDSEPLAIAVATEWDCQKEKIHQSKMHLTTLCNTVIDNPNNCTKYDLVNYMVNYLDTDTVLFQASKDDEDLYTFQAAEWDPLIEWFNKRFESAVMKTREMDGPAVSEEDKIKLRKYLMSYNYAAVNGFMYGVDTLKSVILTIACIERFITVEKAVLLSRLEEEYQLGHWGRVEWAHDLSQQSLQSRLAAVSMFVYFNSQSSILQSKRTRDNPR